MNIHVERDPMWSQMTALEHRMLSQVDFDRAHCRLPKTRILVVMYTKRELDIIKHFWNTRAQGRYLVLINKERRWSRTIIGDTVITDIGGGQTAVSTATSYHIASWVG